FFTELGLTLEGEQPSKGHRGGKVQIMWVSRIALLAVVATTIGRDQVSKHLATSHLRGAPGQSFLADSIRLEYAHNMGSFLSLGSELPSALRAALFSFATAIMLASCA